jgi:Domain of unknown function (DUF4157)
MPFSVPERDQSRGEHTPAAPQVDAVRFPAAGATPQAGTGAPRAAETGARRSPTRLRPSRVPVVQPKLRLGGENDHHEREADRLAEGLAATAVTADHAVAPASVTPASGSAGKAITPSVQQVILDAQGQGRPLPGGERSRDERFLGADFSGVRLHTDHRAGELNRHLGSSAFTAGQDIFFGHGEYDPASGTGREVLDHELVHAAQQASGGALVQLARKKKKQKQGESEDEEYKPRLKKKKKRKIAVESESENENQAALSAKRRRSPGADDDVVSEADIDGKGEADIDGKGDADVETNAEADVRPTGPASAAKRQKVKGAAESIAVESFSQAEMQKYLRGQKLTVPADRPKPVSVGAVVWNINHLKGGGDDVTNPQAATFKPLRTFEPDEILESLSGLVDDLQNAGQALNAAASRVVKQIDSQPGGPGNSAMRSEVSQFQSDVAQLGGLEPEEVEDVVEIGIEAMDQLAKHGGKQDIEVRARQLESVRTLNRIWKRLTRLRVVLFTGTVNDDEDLRPRELIRKVLAKTGLGTSIGDTINRLLTLLPADDLERAVSELKRSTVVDLVTRQFFRNPAINLVLINEMNLGISHLEPKADAEFGLSKGPVMLAKGQALGADAKSGISVRSGEGEQQVGGKQYEYYPALHRTGDNGLEAKGSFYVSTTGEFAPQDRDKGKNLAVPWNKSQDSEEDEATFRGIVVHRYEQDGQEFWAGVLHTTPAGKDLDRRDIWPQIETPLDELNKLATSFKIPLLVGGDFYIPAEGIVRGKRPEMNAVEAAHLGRVKAWNLARNVFLKAAQDESGAKLEKLIANVKKNTKTAKTVRKSRRRAPVTRKRVTPFQPAPGILQAGHSTLWEKYRNLVAKYFKNPEFGAQFDAKEALKLLAPGMGFSDITWFKTLGGGDITELDILRNYRQPPKGDQEKYRERGVEFDDPPPLVTMERVLKNLNYRVVQSGNPTNPKEHGRGENKMQLADLFLVNEYWQTTRSGLVTPDSAQLKPVDTRVLSATQIYWKISDHSPTVLLGSTVPNDPAVHGAFAVSQEARKLAVKANQDEWRRIAQGLAGPNVDKLARVGELIGMIMKQLSQPLDGPTKVVLDVREMVTELREGIRREVGDLSVHQQKALAAMESWEDPFYTTNFSEDLER